MAISSTADQAFGREEDEDQIGDGVGEFGYVGREVVVLVQINGVKSMD